MLAYAYINLLSMLQRFAPEKAVLMATDSIYIKKTVLEKLDGVKAYVASQLCDCDDKRCASYLIGEPFLPHVSRAQWGDNGE